MPMVKVMTRSTSKGSAAVGTAFAADPCVDSSVSSDTGMVLASKFAAPSSAWIGVQVVTTKANKIMSNGVRLTALNLSVSTEPV